MFLVIHKKVLIIYSLSILLIFAGIYYGVQQVIPANANSRTLPIYSVERNDNKVSLTFDVAWGDEDIDEIIKVLNEYNVKCTFFVVGEFIDKYPDAVRKLYQAGHEIANHSNTHPHATKLPSEKIEKEIIDCEEKITSITSSSAKIFRAPYGDYNDTVVKTADKIGFYTIQWDVDSLDWQDKTPQQMLSIISKKIQSGSIILMHTGTKNTAAALPGILQFLKDQNYQLVIVSDLIYKDNYSINHAGKQIPSEKSEQ